MQPFPDLPGFRYWPGRLDHVAQTALLADIQSALEAAPLYRPVTPGGQPFSVRMSNLGPLGWASDRAGYRYQATHPVNDTPWPAIPDLAMRAWEAGSFRAPPQACLVNFYDAKARMGLHQDRDESDFTAPVLSVSLGDTCLFRIGGTERNAPTRSFRLASGDVMLLEGETRLAFHGVDRLYPGTSTLLKEGGRINLTLRRVTKPD